MGRDEGIDTMRSIIVQFSSYIVGRFMSRVICCIAALMVSTSGLYAQGFMGTWQGILKVPQAPNDERIVIKIEASDKEDRPYRAVLQYRPESNAAEGGVG